jgi:hypothetical protein
VTKEHYVSPTVATLDMTHRLPACLMEFPWPLAYTCLVFEFPLLLRPRAMQFCTCACWRWLHFSNGHVYRARTHADNLSTDVLYHLHTSSLLLLGLRLRACHLFVCSLNACMQPRTAFTVRRSYPVCNVLPSFDLLYLYTFTFARPLPASSSPSSSSSV